jgi:putative flippase GtrA
MTFIRYSSIQLLAYGIDMGLFLIVMQSGLSGPILANVMAKLAAGIFAFIAHRSYTFRVSDSPAVRQQAVRYFSLLALNIPVASAILALLLAWVAAPVADKFIADVVCVALSYLLSKHFIFTGQQKPQKAKNSSGAGI